MRKCEQCLYYPKCDEYPFDESGCKDFKDRSHFIELPCAPGDTVYEIENNTEACSECDEYSDFYGMDAICGIQNSELSCYPRSAKTPINMER